MRGLGSVYQWNVLQKVSENITRVQYTSSLPSPPFLLNFSPSAERENSTSSDGRVAARCSGLSGCAGKEGQALDGALRGRE